MAILQSKLNPNAPEFATNVAHNTALADNIATLAGTIAMGGRQSSRERHIARGKLLPRDRVMGLLDKGSPFLEIGLFAAHKLYDTDLPAAGVIAGIGRVSGRDCMILCNDATVKGGTYFPATVKKHLRLQETAHANNPPFTHLCTSPSPRH